jgi:hypothetical protein
MISSKTKEMDTSATEAKIAKKDKGIELSYN